MRPIYLHSVDMKVVVYELEQYDPRLAQFHQLEIELGQEVKSFLPRPQAQLEQSLFRAHYQPEQQKILLAMIDDQVCARLVARMNPTVRDEQGAPLGLIGYFAARETKDAAQLLFDVALEWFKQHGVQQVIGPVSSHFWYESGVNLGPFKRRLFLFEPNNPRYYGDLWEDYGFHIFEDLNSYRVDDLPKLLAMLKIDYQHVLDHDYAFRPFRLSRFDDEIKLMQRLMQQAQLHPHSIANALTGGFIQRLPQLKTYFDPQLALFVMDDMQREVGFIYSLADHLPTVQQTYTGSSLTKWWRTQRAKRAVDVMNVGYVAIARSHQHRRLAKGLIYKMADQALLRDYQQLNFAMIPAGSPIENICRHWSRLFRRYRLYTLWI
ncbi:MAG: hypothetical protein GKR77_01325 [Legionellales bacterium]|nr:hypothetical protein [Legionellales bacterium]